MNERNRGTRYNVVLFLSCTTIGRRASRPAAGSYNVEMCESVDDTFRAGRHTSTHAHRKREGEREQLVGYWFAKRNRAPLEQARTGGVACIEASTTAPLREAGSLPSILARRLTHSQMACLSSGCILWVGQGQSTLSGGGEEGKCACVGRVGFVKPSTLQQPELVASCVWHYSQWIWKTGRES